MKTLEAGGKKYGYFPLTEVEGWEKLPYSLRVLAENLLRCSRTPEEGLAAATQIVEAVELRGNSGSADESGASNAPASHAAPEISFCPSRVLFQDFTGVPVFVDFATMCEAFLAMGGDANRINPLIPCDLVIDHSVIADESGYAACIQANEAREFERNGERYEFLKWAQGSFDNVAVVPPGQGICHQLNIENFSHVVMVKEREGASNAGVTDEDALPLAYFDSVIGTDSHTTTANGIGVLSWGVGGIEAEAAALGQPITTLVPDVVGIYLEGALQDGVAAMDTALYFAHLLRGIGVVGKFVECFGPGVAALSAQQRACIANMTPEYGCTCTLFPVDARTIEFLRETSRSEGEVALVEAYAKAQGFWLNAVTEAKTGVDAGSGMTSNASNIDTTNAYAPSASTLDEAVGQRIYSEVIRVDLSEIQPSIAGPSRPHDLIGLDRAKDAFRDICKERGLNGTATVQIGGETFELADGAIALSAITSCTTATDPAMMVQAGLFARAAQSRGISPKPWVKTVFAPGSRATDLLLSRAGLKDALEALGFFNCGFGCMSCIGNSGPLLAGMTDISGEIELASVLSGNRNFEGRISPHVAQNYLMTPAHVIAYALAGTIDIDLSREPLGQGADGNDVFMTDLMPADSEIDEVLGRVMEPGLYRSAAESLHSGGDAWQAVMADASDTYSWDAQSTYVRRPPYFDGMPEVAAPASSDSDAEQQWQTLSQGLCLPQASDIENAVCLVNLGDFITTDHISPAGSIAPDSPAAKYLADAGVAPGDFNTYGARRGNHEVMMRGTFANVRLQNKLAQGRRGGWTTDILTGKLATVYDAAMHYRREGVPSIVLAGRMYGSGSSRDWAAKGPYLLGVRAVIAQSFERIHRSNLIGMGILPLQFMDGNSADSLGLDGTERFTIHMPDCSCGLPNPGIVQVEVVRPDGGSFEFSARVRIDTATEGEYFSNGGILQYVLRSLL